MTTKIFALTDALRYLVRLRLRLMPGYRFDTVGVPPLLAGAAFGGLIADKSFDSAPQSPISMNTAPRPSLLASAPSQTATA